MQNEIITSIENKNYGERRPQKVRNTEQQLLVEHSDWGTECRK